ncbi:MAG TPA: hypothetical protein VLA72_01950 [Anaerolineales bacterium]|nr:hypothetical protein [Anaerolineales bacterium]
MDKRTIGIIATVVSAFICGCASIFSCVWGVVIVSGQPIDVTSNGVTTPEVLSPTIGYVLLCLTVLMITIPIAVGFFTFRKKKDEEQPVNIID